MNLGNRLEETHLSPWVTVHGPVILLLTQARNVDFYPARFPLLVPIGWAAQACELSS